MRFIILVVLILVLFHESVSYLTVKGTDLYHNNEKVYLSGVNIAWYHYDYDWGNGFYIQNRKVWIEWLDLIAKSGGNSARVWLHVEGSTSPKYDNSGTVTGTDNKNSLIQEMGMFLDDAAHRNIFIIFVLWNGALMRNQNTANLFLDDHKLQSYIDHCLVPMVKGLHGKKSLAAWEIINEPEGAIQVPTHDSDRCFDTTKLQNTGAGWAHKNIPMKNMLRSINWQTAAIHSADPSAVVTVGSWSLQVLSNVHPEWFDHYSDECMHKAGGKSNGNLDFYQSHTYDSGSESPIKNNAHHYGLNRPLVIGEYSTKKSNTHDPTVTTKHYYNSGYSGALSWQYSDNHDDATDTREEQNRGMSAIMNERTHGIVKVKIG